MEKQNKIYHIVTLDDLKAQIKDNYYKPINFEQDGFIHCTAEKPNSLIVLEDYFAEISKSHIILILEIDITKLKSVVKFELPAPIKGLGIGHLKEGLLFPHIYGSLNIDSVTGIGKVDRVDGRFVWPSTFDKMEII